MSGKHPWCISASSQTVLLIIRCMFFFCGGKVKLGKVKVFCFWINIASQLCYIRFLLCNKWLPPHAFHTARAKQTSHHACCVSLFIFVLYIHEHLYKIWLSYYVMLNLIKVQHMYIWPGKQLKISVGLGRGRRAGKRKGKVWRDPYFLRFPRVSWAEHWPPFTCRAASRKEACGVQEWSCLRLFLECFGLFRGS